MKKNSIILLMSLIGLASIFLYQAKNANRIDDIPGKFEEINKVRNENNEGTVQLIYCFKVNEPAVADFKKLGNALPFNEHNSQTTVFFFDANHPMPKTLNIRPPHFDTFLYKPVAVFTRTTKENSQVTIYEQ